jgi:hypothetical protein
MMYRAMMSCSCIQILRNRELGRRIQLGVMFEALACARNKASECL